MGSMNAMAWLLVEAARPDVERLWLFTEELRERLGDRIAGEPPALHGFDEEAREAGIPRFCFHPTGEQHVELRSNSLTDAMLAGCTYLAKLMPEDEMWRRDDG